MLASAMSRTTHDREAKIKKQLENRKINNIIALHTIFVLIFAGVSFRL
jgi:hypothetical protein